MKSRLIAAGVVAAALLLPATASAKLAQANQFEGTLTANSCGAARDVVVNGPTRITAMFAATNATGLLYAQILTPSGAVVSTTGSYTTPGAGSYGVRACLLGSDYVDLGPFDYVGMVATG
jgi:hypothetical protein